MVSICMWVRPRFLTLLACCLAGYSGFFSHFQFFFVKPASEFLFHHWKTESMEKCENMRLQIFWCYSQAKTTVCLMLYGSICSLTTRKPSLLSFFSPNLCFFPCNMIRSWKDVILLRNEFSSAIDKYHPDRKNMDVTNEESLYMRGSPRCTF